MGNVISFNELKLQELILYIARESQDDPRFGATKLNKLLFYIDFGSYRMLGQPVTGATYQHLPAGPAPRQVLDARRYLIDSGHATTEYREYFSGTQERIVPARDPDMSLFSKEEIKLIDSVIAEFWDFNARRLSEYSHSEWGWKVTEDFDDMPYHLAWVSSDPITPEQIEIGQQIAQEHGFLLA